MKVAEVLLAGTVANVGTGSDALLLESVTALPPDGAPWLRVIVQVVAAPELTLVGLQATAETSVGATKPKVVVCKAPFKVALTLALWLVVKAPAVAMKLAELAPIGTVTDAGIVSRALLSDNATMALA